jgi:hypothetical protein
VVEGALEVIPSTPNSQIPTPKKTQVLSAAAGLGGFVLGYLPQLIAYNGLNGYPGPAQHVTRKMFWYAPHGLQVLFSPHHGFFFWTPLAVLGITGLVIAATTSLAVGAGFSRPEAAVGAGFSRPDTRRIALCALIMIASQVYVAGSVASWTVAGAFGQRRFVCLTPLLVIGIACLWQARPVHRVYRVALGTTLVVCIWWNIALMAQFATGLMDRQRLEPGRNAYNAFVRLPLETPSLVYRYLTNRESFYKKG